MERSTISLQQPRHNNIILPRSRSSPLQIGRRRILWALLALFAALTLIHLRHHPSSSTEESQKYYDLGLKAGKKKRPSFILSVTNSNKEVTFPLQSKICPTKVRAGSSGDGGWWLCSSESVPDTNCVVYSFGIRDNFSFDHYLANRGCTVHGFDPSPDGLSSKATYEQGQEGHAVFHSFGLGKDGVYQPGKVPFRWPGMDYLENSNTYPWELKSLPTIQKELDNRHVSIVKVDIEGGEWDMLSDIIDAEWDELYMELHFYPGSFYLFETDDGGLNVVEVNHKSPREQKPEQNVDRVDRIGLLKRLAEVADLFWWDANNWDTYCAEVYFRRKRPVVENGSKRQ